MTRPGRQYFKINEVFYKISERNKIQISLTNLLKEALKFEALVKDDWLAVIHFHRLNRLELNLL